MDQPLPDTDLVVATPERVSFDYQVAGLGTRAIAQILDLLILTGVLMGLYFAAVAVGAAGFDVVAYLIAIIGSFVIIFGYFWTCEAFWSGQTVGKKVFRLRAVGDRGEPMTFVQAGIRNVVRIVDFLPYAYGVGFVVLFIGTLIVLLEADVVRPYFGVSFFNGRFYVVYKVVINLFDCLGI